MIKYFGKYSPIHVLINDCHDNDIVAINRYDSSGRLSQLLSMNTISNKKDINYIASFDLKLDLPLFSYLNGNLDAKELPKRYGNNDVWVKFLNKDFLHTDTIINIIKYCDEHIWKQFILTKEYMIDVACSIDNIDFILWLLNQGCKFDEHNLETVIKDCGNLEIIKLLKQFNCPWREYTFNIAILSCNLDIIKWLKDHDCPINEFTVFDIAIETNNLDIITWIHNQGYKPDSYTFSIATEFLCDLVILQFLHNINCTWDSRVFKYALSNGNIPIITWLINNNYTFHIPSQAYEWASNIDVLKLLKHYNFPLPLNSNAFNQAVKKGDFIMMEWLNNEGFKYDEQTFLFCLDDLSIMKWLRSHNCPWNESTFNCAIHFNLSSVTLEWLKHEGCPWSKKTFQIALEKNNKDIITWLLNNGCPY